MQWAEGFDDVYFVVHDSCEAVSKDSGCHIEAYRHKGYELSRVLLGRGRGKPESFVVLTPQGVFS